MKKIVKFLLALVLLIPFMVEAKEITYRGKIVGDGYGDNFQTVIDTDDGYIAASNIYLAEIEGIPSLGGTDIRIFKYNKDTFDVKSQIIYGGSSDDYVYDMVESTSDGVVMVGNTKSTDIEGLTNKGVRDAIIVKFNNNGDIIWQKNYGGSSNDSFRAISNTADGGYIVVGESKSTDVDGLTNQGSDDAIIVKYDKDGNIVWQKNYGGSKLDKFSDVITVRNGYIAVGYSYSTNIDGLGNNGSNDAIIIKFDLEGNVVWQKNYGGSGNDIFNSITLLDDGSVVATAKSDSTDILGIENMQSYDGVVVKYDENGNLLWQKKWGGSNGDYFNKVKSISNELIIVGFTHSDDIEGITLNSSKDAIMLKYDLNGNLLEQQSIGGNGNDEFLDVIKTEKGFIFVGNSYSTNLPNIPYDGGYEGALILEYTINYDLQKETDTIKNGTYDLKQVGQRAEISINPDNGYELDNIVVTDTNGNKLTYYEENGKYYVDLTDDIVVDVKYKQKSIINPNTTGLIMLGEIIILVSTLTGLYFYIKRKRIDNAI